MTPKEKAQELYDQFNLVVPLNLALIVDGKCRFNTKNIDAYVKMQCLICVDEMLAIEKKYSNYGGYAELLEVKSEIEKL
jgi:hypothetical protein